MTTDTGMSAEALLREIQERVQCLRRALEGELIARDPNIAAHAGAILGQHVTPLHDALAAPQAPEGEDSTTREDARLYAVVQSIIAKHAAAAAGHPEVDSLIDDLADALEGQPTPAPEPAPEPDTTPWRITTDEDLQPGEPERPAQGGEG